MHSTQPTTEQPSVEQVSSVKQARERAGKSRNWVAAVADVSPQLVRVYEIAPHEVRDADKRQALDAVYAKLREGRVAEMQADLRRSAGV